MIPRLIVAAIILAIGGIAFATSLRAKPASATIVCNPQPTPELIRWHRSKEVRT